MSDYRQVSQATTLFTGSPGSMSPAGCSPLSACSIPVTFTAIFDEEVVVSSITAADLSISCTSGCGPATATVTSVTPQNGNKVFVFAISITGMTLGGSQGASWSVYVLDDAGTFVSNGAVSKQSSAVTLRLDMVPPQRTQAQTIVTTVKAAMLVPFFYNVSGLFTDSISSSDALGLTLVTMSSSVGMSMIRGKQGMAYITGAATAAPAGGYVDFTVAASDEAGNVADSSVLSHVLRVYVLGSSEWGGVMAGVGGVGSGEGWGSREMRRGGMWPLPHIHSSHATAHHSLLCHPALVSLLSSPLPCSYCLSGPDPCCASL